MSQPRYEDLELRPVEELPRIPPPIGRGTSVLSWVLVLVALFTIVALLVATPRRASEAYPQSPALPEASSSGGVVRSSPEQTGPTSVVANVGSVVTGRTPPERIVLPATDAAVSGRASWYCGAGSRCTRGYGPSTLSAAAGAALRTGDWRGRLVRVCSGDRCVRVRLVDWCFCGSGRVIDLYRSAFSRLASPSRGVIRVTVSWVGDRGPTGTLPPTDSR